MDIDQRLEALVQRHEALTQSVELLTHDVHQMQANIGTLFETAKQDGENIRGLVRIADIHERRLKALEAGDATQRAKAKANHTTAQNRVPSPQLGRPHRAPTDRRGPAH